MKNLVIVTHPDLQNSVINKAWVHALEKHPNDFTIHSLYDLYPDLKFDIESEQELWSNYDNIIFQFPIHWFNTPFALKKYIDEVFTYGWAFGPGGDKLIGKKIGLAVSTGGEKESYQEPNGITLHNLLNDFVLTFQYCRSRVTHLHSFHGAMFEPSEEQINENAKEYLNAFLKKHEISSV